LKKEQSTGSTGIVLPPFLVEENLLQSEVVQEKFQNIFHLKIILLNIAFKMYLESKFLFQKISQNILIYLDILGFSSITLVNCYKFIQF